MSCRACSWHSICPFLLSTHLHSNLIRNLHHNQATIVLCTNILAKAPSGHQTSVMASGLNICTTMPQLPLEIKLLIFDHYITAVITEHGRPAPAEEFRLQYQPPFLALRAMKNLHSAFPDCKKEIQNLSYRHSQSSYNAWRNPHDHPCAISNLMMAEDIPYEEILSLRSALAARIYSAVNSCSAVKDRER